MSQRNKNLRDVVDNVFRRASPTTPPKIVQEVLSEDSKSSSRRDNSNENLPTRYNTLPRANFIDPEASITLPAVNVTPIESENTNLLPEKKSVWYVLTIIVLLLATAFCVVYFWSPIRRFLTESFTVADLAKETPNVMSFVPKSVKFDESKNTVRYIDTNEAPLAAVKVFTSSETTKKDETKNISSQQNIDSFTNSAAIKQQEQQERQEQQEQQKRQDSFHMSAANMNPVATLEKLELSLDNLAKTNLDLQAQRDAAINATNQREQGAALRLSEKDQYSMTDRLESMPMNSDDTRESLEKIYGAHSGNSVVGNREMAPFVTFAPGQEPFEGMVPDYDEAEHGSQKSMPPPLQAGRPHGILELINDHCMRTGKPMPKAGDRSTMDIMSKRDTGDLAPMRVADVDGHYLQSQKKQLELARLNSQAIKKIYAHKDAVSAGQILDRGDSLLGQFAGAQGDDAVQYLNINSL